MLGEVVIIILLTNLLDLKREFTFLARPFMFTPMNGRICRFCYEQGNTIVEDETHFLLKCPQYSMKRENKVSIGAYLMATEILVRLIKASHSCFVVDVHVRGAREGWGWDG